MALVTDKSVFLHVPKCAGMLIRHAFHACKIPHEELGDQHSHFPELFKHRPPPFFKQRKVFAFIRHPLPWYQSRWAFRMKHGWQLRHPLDYNCASNDFRVFVHNCLNYKPDGWFTWECRSYIDGAAAALGRPIDFVGRSERAIDDLECFLELAGEKFNPKVLRNLARVNDSDLDGRPSGFFATYTEDLLRRVVVAEAEVINRYYRHQECRVQASPRPY